MRSRIAAWRCEHFRRPVRSRSCRCPATAPRSSGPSTGTCARPSRPRGVHAELERRFGHFLGDVDRRAALVLSASAPARRALRGRAPGPDRRFSACHPSDRGPGTQSRPARHGGPRRDPGRCQAARPRPRRSDLLERYQRWRRFDNVALMAATEALNRLFSNSTPLVRLVRDLGLGIVNELPRSGASSCATPWGSSASCRACSRASRSEGLLARGIAPRRHGGHGEAISLSVPDRKFAIAPICRPGESRDPSRHGYRPSPVWRKREKPTPKRSRSPIPCPPCLRGEASSTYPRLGGSRERPAAARAAR